MTGGNPRGGASGRQNPPFLIVARIGFGISSDILLSNSRLAERIGVP